MTDDQRPPDPLPEEIDPLGPGMPVPNPEPPSETLEKEENIDPKDQNALNNPGNFGIPEKAPTPAPDYFSHDAPISESDLPPINPAKES